MKAQPGESLMARAARWESSPLRDAPTEEGKFVDPAIQEAKRRLDLARQNLISAALAYGDGLISEGQLKAVRQLLRERDLRYQQLLAGRSVPPFKDSGHEAESHTALQSDFTLQDNVPDVQAPHTAQAAPTEHREPACAGDPSQDEISARIRDIEEKLARLEENYEQGRINRRQYDAIRRHYNDQREVARRLIRTHPESDRWRVVLQPGKTTFLMQLNEAACRAMAIYDAKSRQRLFLEGELPLGTEDAMNLLGTFGQADPTSEAGRMYATESDDGSILILVPGQFTAALLVFSNDPPSWQLETLREVHRNFEAANKRPLSRDDHSALLFPDLRRIIHA
jgi:hypothetical protein